MMAKSSTVINWLHRAETACSDQEYIPSVCDMDHDTTMMNLCALNLKIAARRLWASTPLAIMFFLWDERPSVCLLWSTKIAPFTDWPIDIDNMLCPLLLLAINVCFGWFCCCWRRESSWILRGRYIWWRRKAYHLEKKRPSNNHNNINLIEPWNLISRRNFYGLSFMSGRSMLYIGIISSAHPASRWMSSVMEWVKFRFIIKSSIKFRETRG